SVTDPLKKPDDLLLVFRAYIRRIYHIHLFQPCTACIQHTKSSAESDRLYGKHTVHRIQQGMDQICRYLFSSADHPCKTLVHEGFLREPGYKQPFIRIKSC